MKKVFLFITVIVLAIITGCSHTSNKQFEKLLSEKLNNKESVNHLIDFEIDNPKHFESKLYLAEYYISLQEYQTAEQYLKRAEKIQRKVKSKEDLAKLYLYLAQLAYLRQDYESSIEYGLDVKKFDGNQKYLSIDYLLGQCYFKTNNTEKALSYFDSAYKSIPGTANATDLKTYMYLLSETDRVEDCINIIENYLTQGNWFYGLGSLASSMYEKDNKIQEALLFAFLDYDFYSSVYESDDLRFLENLHNVENQLKETNQIEIARPVLDLIRSLYLNDIHCDDNAVVNNFASTYLIIRNKIKESKVTSRDLNLLLIVEPFLFSFPVYYWSVWECVKQIDENEVKKFLPVLKKTIAINPSGVYAYKARNEISRIYGINITEDTDLDSLLF